MTLLGKGERLRRMTPEKLQATFDDLVSMLVLDQADGPAVVDHCFKIAISYCMANGLDEDTFVEGARAAFKVYADMVREARAART